MKSNKIAFVFNATLICAALSSCGGGTSSSPPSGSGGCPSANSSCTSAAGPIAIPTSSISSVPLYIGDSSTTGSYSYPNEPLVSVTICSPNHTSGSQCTTVSNILLDTGSYGLRVFASAIPSNVQLVQQTITVQGQSLNLAECAEFGTGADWGPVQNGDVLMGNQTASNIPIQVINIGFGQIPSGCSSLCPDTDPCTAGYNGILGVGLFAQDCGTDCSLSMDDSVNPGIYFGCISSGCFDGMSGNCGTDGACMFEVPASEQVVNPIAKFSTGYNNGVALTLPSVGPTGASGITNGTLQLGIGTPASVTVYPADSSGMTDGNGADFTTVFQSVTYGGSSSDPDNTNDPMLAFIDSGSNAISFPSGISQCSDASGFYCGGSTQSLSALMEGFSATPTGSISFSVANSDSLFNTGNSAFSNLGGPAQGMFDWGLPFFYGRTVYVGINGASATVNSSPTTGPYWAF